MRPLCVLVAALCCAIAQGAQIESSQDLIERLTPQQKQQFDLASQAFNSQRYADALAGFKALLQELPSEPVLSKFAAESGLNSGDEKFAVDILGPLVQKNPDDWQATALLARAYAGIGDNKARDAAMAHMLE